MFDRNKWNFLLWIHYLKYISIFDFLWLLDYSFVHYVVIFVSFEMMFQTCSYLSEKIFQFKVQIHSFRTFVHKFACFLKWKCIEYVGSRRVNVFFSRNYCLWQDGFLCICGKFKVAKLCKIYAIWKSVSNMQNVAVCVTFRR